MTHRLTEVVAQQVRRLRDEQRKSAQALANDCARLGSPSINRDAISNLEAGRRRAVTVEEVAVLALALNVAPTHLMVAPGDPEMIEVSGEVTASNLAMRAWLASRAPLPGQDVFRYAGEAISWLEGLPKIDEGKMAGAREHDELVKQLMPPINNE